MLQKQVVTEENKSALLTEDVKLKQVAKSAGEVSKRLEAEQVDEVGQKLLEAADWLENNYWCQGKLHVGGHSSCAIGSLGRVIPHKGLPSKIIYALAYARLAKVVNSLNKGKSSDIAHWNDKKGRKKTEVVAALKAAAKLK